MSQPLPRARLLAIMFAALALPGCTGVFTGPVEVTRFVAENPAGLGSGSIATVIAQDEDEPLRVAVYEQAIRSELTDLGYASTPGGAQEATITVERSRIDSTGRRNPVSVGVGGSTGGFRSGVGAGVGITLGGGQRARLITELAVRITSVPDGETLWEGRAELVTSDNSPFADTRANARALAAALFKDFPGGNGETVSIEVDELEGTQ
ncbi:MAG: hypothetical protein AAF250_05020 [Pseudomonadota bacterium]